MSPVYSGRATRRTPFNDETFDDVYSPLAERLSRRHWTPVAVARRAARILRDAGARTVLDVGSGAGKFVLAAALAAPELYFVGVEHRDYLFAASRRAQEELRIPNASFVVGDATQMFWGDFDGLYLFNPFEENLLANHHERIDSTVELSRGRFGKDVLRCEHRLRAARLGTSVVTFNGCGVSIPASYELIAEERLEGATLRLWSKMCVVDDGRFYEEHDHEVRVYDAGIGRRPV